MQRAARSKELGTINWLGRILYLTGIVSLLFGIETFTGSMIEHEARRGVVPAGALHKPILGHGADSQLEPPLLIPFAPPATPPLRRKYPPIGRFEG